MTEESSPGCQERCLQTPRWLWLRRLTMTCWLSSGASVPHIQNAFLRHVLFSSGRTHIWSGWRTSRRRFRIGPASGQLWDVRVALFPMEWCTPDRAGQPEQALNQWVRARTEWIGLKTSRAWILMRCSLATVTSSCQNADEIQSILLLFVLT